MANEIYVVVPTGDVLSIDLGLVGVEFYIEGHNVRATIESLEDSVDAGVSDSTEALRLIREIERLSD
ncbi:hypothetical protein HGA91_06185 [candidate division WWE3 bacterium]|nr:hypothetical protein [candidate division WWE3 bacterium]